MPTADLRVDLALKRFLSQNRLSTNFLIYLRNEYLDLGARIFPASGLFTFPVTITPNWGAGTFAITPDPTEGIDNAGHVLQAEDASRCTGISFANVVGHYYWLGLQYIEVPDSVYANPRTGIAEYDMVRNEIGEKDDPTSVVDTGLGTIELNCNSIFQVGISHAGRSVMVWLKNPISIDVTVAIETRTVSYAAPNNLITTTGALGQGSISVNPADYYVACLGVSVYDDGVVPGPCPFGPEYVVLGYILGGAPGSTSIADQLDLSGGGGHTLQKAYDGLAGSGSGNDVLVADQAIILRQENLVSRDCDISNSALRIRKDIPTTLHNLGFLDEGGIDIAMRFEAAHSIMCRCSIHDMTGTDQLRVEEDVSITGPATLTFTRGAPCDLTLPPGPPATYSVIRTAVDLVEITGSALGQDGIYRISVVAAGALTCTEYNSPVATVWVNEAGLKARIFRPVIRFNTSSHAIAINPVSDFYRDFNAGAAMPYGQITVSSPDNTHDDEKIFYNWRSADYFYTTAEGGVFHTGSLNIKSTSSQIIFDALAPPCADGIEMNGRGIDLGTGYMTNVGLMTFDAGAGTGIDMNGRALNMDGGDINNADDITSTTGNIVASVGYVQATLGDVKAGNDVIADNDNSGVGDFKYGGAKHLVKMIDASEAIGGHGPFIDDTFTPVFCSGVHTDEGDGTHPEYDYWAGVGGAGDYGYVVFPFTLPQGATITGYDVLATQLGASGFRCELVKLMHDLVTPALVGRVSLDGPTLSGGGAGLTVFSAIALAAAVSPGYRYQILVRLESTAKVYLARVSYDMTSFRYNI